MQISVAGSRVYFATGGRPFLAGQPHVLLVHGAGLDHTVWALQSRWLAFHGWNVLAVDLPGHGASQGAPLPTVEALAAWVVSLLDAAGIERAMLIGHSMGSLVALEVAAVAPGRVRGLVLIGTAASMPVHEDLLAAAKANDHSAIDMVNLWGYGYHAGVGGSPAPGLWMVGVGERTLERAAPGVLHADLSACHAYKGALEAASRVRAPTVIVGGSKDQMTPLRSARALASAIPGASMIVLDGAGHMLLSERPDELIAAIRALASAEA